MTDSSATWSSPDLIVQDGGDGLSVHAATIYRRSATAPSTPTGGSYDFGTQTLTPPTNWSEDIPEDDGNDGWFSEPGTQGDWLALSSAREWRMRDTDSGGLALQTRGPRFEVRPVGQPAAQGRTQITANRTS